MTCTKRLLNYDDYLTMVLEQQSLVYAVVNLPLMIVEQGTKKKKREVCTTVCAHKIRSQRDCSRDQ